MSEKKNQTPQEINLRRHIGTEVRKNFVTPTKTTELPKTQPANNTVQSNTSVDKLTGADPKSVKKPDKQD